MCGTNHFARRTIDLVSGSGDANESRPQGHMDGVEFMTMTDLYPIF